MSDLPSPLSRSEVLEQLRGLGFRFHGKRGQNFLFDENLLKALVRDAGVEPGDRILEVGSGAGTLTRCLLAAGGHVTSVEIDPILCQFVGRHLAHPNLSLIECDVLETKNRIAAAVQEALDDLTEGGSRSFSLVANLPYSIASPLVAMLVSQRSDLDRLGVLVQREVAERWIAPPGTREYGTATVLLSLLGSGHISRRVPAHAFVPAPKVESAFYTWTRSPAAPELPAGLVELVRECFGQRRKTIGKLLRDRLDPQDRWWQQCPVEPSTRPDQLDPEQWLSLARKVESLED